MRRIAFAFASAPALGLSVAPALAEVPRMSLVFAPDVLSAQTDDIRSVRRVDEGSRGSALVIRLSPAFDAQMLAITAAHVGETGTLLICGETVLEPVLHSAIAQATFVISDTDPARIDRLQARLEGAACGDAPES
jgi:hypothetical protein